MGQADYGAARRNFQAHAVRLELPVGHLPTFRPIAPRAPSDRPSVDLGTLSAAVQESTTWAEVLRRLGFRQSGSIQARIRSQADQQGVDWSHFRGQAWGAAPVPFTETPFTRPRSVRHLPQAAPTLAAAWFMERGYRVSMPIEPAPYDLVVEADDGFVRVQVKSASKVASNGHYEAAIYRQSYRNSTARDRCTYSADEVDVFFIVTSSGDMFLIPLSVTGRRASLVLDAKYAEFKV
jgi:hypothetical protein